MFRICQKNLIIGVICSYRGQVTKLTSIIGKEKNTIINTIDSF